MTATILISFAGFVLALLMSYLPKFGAWFNVQPSATKVQINGGLLLAIALGAFALGCFGVEFDYSVACSQDGAIKLLGYLMTALISNQTAYTAFVKPFPQNNPKK